MSYLNLNKGKYNWHWKQYGSGNRLMLAFHGFNRSPDDFHPFERWLGAEYTILAFDLFFHGKSSVQGPEEPSPLTYPELKSMMDAILLQYQATNFEVLAYSFGGRLALNCVELYGSRVTALYLMASDAMRFNPGYFFLVQTQLGRMVFRRFLKKPEPALRIMKMASAVGLYNKKAMSFFINHIEFEPMRYKVFQCWMLHRNTVPDLNNVSEIIQTNKIRLLLFFGKYDIVIPPKLGKRFAKKCKKPEALHLLEIGHRLPEKHEEICSIILHQ